MQLGIVLTATVEVAVKGGNFTHDERFRMYEETLDFYAQKIGNRYPIVLVENSNADLSEWERRYKDTLNLEIIQFRPDNQKGYEYFDPQYGKGYNEYLMIKKGLNQSKLLAKHGVTHFLKITGRYPMLNIRSIIREAKYRIGNHNIVYMGDIKHSALYSLIGKSDSISAAWGDSRFFVADLQFWKRELSDCYKWMNDHVAGRWAEHYFVALSEKYRHDKRFIFRYRTQVRFGGVSGTLTSEQLKAGVGRHDSLANRVRIVIRQIMRILLPWLWI